MSTDLYELDILDGPLSEEQIERRAMTPTTPEDPPADGHAPDPSEMRIRRAAWFRLQGQTWENTAKLCSVSRATVKRWGATDVFKQAQAEFSLAEDDRIKAAQAMLQARQLTYLEEADRIALDRNGTHASVRANMLQNLMDRDKSVPKYSPSLSSGNAAQLTISEQGLEAIARGIAQTLPGPQPAIEATAERVDE